MRASKWQMRCFLSERWQRRFKNDIIWWKRINGDIPHLLRTLLRHYSPGQVLSLCSCVLVSWGSLLFILISSRFNQGELGSWSCSAFAPLTHFLSGPFLRRFLLLMCFHVFLNEGWSLRWKTKGQDFKGKTQICTMFCGWGCCGLWIFEHKRKTNHIANCVLLCVNVCCVCMLERAYVKMGESLRGLFYQFQSTAIPWHCEHTLLYCFSFLLACKLPTDCETFRRRKKQLKINANYKKVLLNEKLCVCVCVCMKKRSSECRCCKRVCFPAS